MLSVLLQSHQDPEEIIYIFYKDLCLVSVKKWVTMKWPVKMLGPKIRPVESLVCCQTKQNKFK